MMGCRRGQFELKLLDIETACGVTSLLSTTGLFFATYYYQRVEQEIMKEYEREIRNTQLCICKISYMHEGFKSIFYVKLEDIIDKYNANPKCEWQIVQVHTPTNIPSNIKVNISIKL